MKVLQILYALMLLLVPRLVFGQAPDLGVASTFALFTADGAFNGDPGTSVVGDIGTNVGAFTPPGLLVGNIHVADPVSAQAASDVAIAYGVLDGLTCGLVLATPFGNNQTLTPNIYCVGSAAVLNANLTLDGGGNPGAIFIFQIDGALSTNFSSNILLINGASLCNVYWQINGAFNHNGTLFQGTVIAAGAINFGFGSKLTGRGLSTQGAISTRANVITIPSSCLCSLNVSCPNPSGGTFQCPGNIPAGAPADVTILSACGTPSIAITNTSSGAGCAASPYILTRTYKVTDQGGHSQTCVVTYTAIDQTRPTLTCPPSLTVSCAGNVPAAAPTSVSATDNCTGAVSVVSLGDVVTPGTCPNRFSISRTYRASDACGNSATCAQTITVNDLTAPIFTNPPTNITVECSSIPAVPQNLPVSDNCNGVVTVTFLGETQTPGICPTLYTLTRTWRATDACGNSTTISQTIIVQDTYAPQFVVKPANVVLECNQMTNLDAYQAWLDSHGGASVSDCSTITWTYENSPFLLDTAGCGASFRRYIRFIATDACGNSSFRDASFTVVDLTPPVFTLLPQNLEVECLEGDDGEALIPDWLEHFGYAEVSDACGAVYTEVVLLKEKQECGNTFTRTYQFRATDECGNTNFVTATFAIVDHTPPVILHCPESNVLLTCEFDVPLPDTAGVIATDNCGPVKVTVQDIFTVGVGCVYWPLTTSYTYAVTDACGNVSTCYQSFQVIDSIPPVYSGPDTIYVLCVADLPGPEDLTDVLAPYFVDNCYSIICVSEYVETNDSNSVTFCVHFKDLCVNWADTFHVTFIATGGCKPLCSAPQNEWGNAAAAINGMNTHEAIEQLLNKYGAVKAGKLGKTISVSSAACLQTLLPGYGNTNPLGHGNFVFGNTNECQTSSPLLNDDGTLKNTLAANALALQLNIWYNVEFNGRDLGVQLLTSLPPSLIDPIVLSKLEVDHHNVQGLLNLANNYLAGIYFYPPDFGSPLNEALENVNSYWQDCQPNAPNLVQSKVAGYLQTVAQEGLEDAKVQLAVSTNGTALPGAATLSNGAGFYQYSNAVPVLGSYTVTPSSEGLASLNGVTTYDLVLISKHILGWKPLDSPYAMIAADANKSGSITSFDLIELRKLILGVYDVLPDNTSWRFIDKSFVFPDPTNPFATVFPERKSAEQVQGNQTKEDFVCVKIGDINGTAQANALMSANERSEGMLLFDLDDRTVNSGETFQVRMIAGQLVQAYQFTLNTKGLELLEVSGAGMGSDNFAVFPEAAAMTTSWNLPEGTPNQKAAFTMTLRATQSGRLSQMLSLSNRITQAVAYGEQNNDSHGPIPLDIALRFSDKSGSTVLGKGFELYQNVPNPFLDKTVIGFQLPEDAQAVLTVYDQTGRLVYTAKGDFAEGYNTFSIERELLQTTGTMLYQVKTATDMATRKMIQVK